MATSIETQIQLEFIQHHLPALKAGLYQFSGHQLLSGEGIGTAGKFQVDLGTHQVQVAGERYTLNPTEIVSVFPPKNSLGHYANVLPHISLRRETLPWERMVAESEQKQGQLEKAPWLALLVLEPEELYTDEGQKPGSIAQHLAAEQGYVKPVSELKDQGEEQEENLRLIYVHQDTLKQLIPNITDLSYLVHARRSRLVVTGLDATSNQEVTIEIWNEAGKLVHRELNRKVPSNKGISLDCGVLSPGKYTIKVLKPETSEVVASEALTLKPSDSLGDEVAVVIANRLPKAGHRSIVHLVSLEGRFDAEKDPISFDPAGYGEVVPLVSLHSWSFTALTEKETFRNLLLHLNHPFLFGIDISEDLRSNFTIENLRSPFLTGQHPLGQGATIVDRAIQELRDKDHCYYIGQEGAIYNAAGRQLVPPGDSSSQEAIEARLSGHRVHKKTAKLKPTSTLQAWLNDKPRSYFLSEDETSKRLLVHQLPTNFKPTLRLPEREGHSSATAANVFLQQGYVPLPHTFRRGGKSVSWYRGPLVPGKVEKTIPPESFPAQAADELLRYHTDYGMFDASYASAWELGRLLALRDKHFSKAFFRWKRSHVQLIKAMEQQHLYAHLPFRTEAPGRITLPPLLEQWISKLSLLKNIPFHYLVPDAKMLPRESLRFFYLDPGWTASLVDGALSIGRVNTSHEKILDPRNLADTAKTSDQITGFLLRSRVVSGWPKLQVNGYRYTFPANNPDEINDSIPEADEQGNPTSLPCLRMERLSEDVLLCLFQGEVKVLDIHEKPETVHFGFHLENEGSSARYTKSPINAQGHESDDHLLDSKTMGFINLDNRVISPTVLVNKLRGFKLGYSEPFTSAQLGQSMIEGVSCVRFIA